jgi:hypothetical protein
MTGNRPAKKQFKPYPLGYFPIYIAEVCTEEGKLYMFVAIDRVSKFAYAELHTKSHKAIAAEFLRHLITAVPYKIHTVLTDNGIQFIIRRAINTPSPISSIVCVSRLSALLSSMHVMLACP